MFRREELTQLLCQLQKTPIGVGKYTAIRLSSKSLPQQSPVCCDDDDDLPPPPIYLDSSTPVESEDEGEEGLPAPALAFDSSTPVESEDEEEDNLPAPPLAFDSSTPLESEDELLSQPLPLEQPSCSAPADEKPSMPSLELADDEVRSPFLCPDFLSNLTREQITLLRKAHLQRKQRIRSVGPDRDFWGLREWEVAEMEAIDYYLRSRKPSRFYWVWWKDTSMSAKDYTEFNCLYAEEGISKIWRDSTGKLMVKVKWEKTKEPYSCVKELADSMLRKNQTQTTFSKKKK